MSTEVTCCVTGKTLAARRRQDGSPALPPGWKHLSGAYYSPPAWRQRFSMRTVRLPIGGIECEVNSPEAHSEAWTRLREALRISWRQATQVSNWMITEFAKADTVEIVRGPQGPTLPKMVALTELMRRTYQEGRGRWPELDSQSFCSLRHRVLAKYKQVRYDLRCRAAVSLPTFVYPTPLPIPAKDTKLILEQGRATLHVRISGDRFPLRLRGGREFRRPLSVVERIAKRELLQGEICLYEQPVGGAHHAGGTHKLTGRPTRVMAAISVWLPNEQLLGHDRTCSVVTGRSRLWQVLLDGASEPWHLNEDQIPRWTAAYYEQLQRLREDCKLDRRTRHPDDLARRRAELRIKFKNRIADACHQAAALLVGFCRRHRVAVVDYDDSDTSWLPNFTWYELRRICAEKCLIAGITFRASKVPPVSLNE